MAKRKRSIDIDKMIKEGRGQGIGVEYKPWIRIQDVPSLGRSTRLKGIKTKRQHEFLSDMERNYFYLLEFSDSIVDIREQFPLLPLEDTILIAEELGLEHPKNPTTGESIVMTTDFFISIKNNNEFYEVARTIKAKDELMNRRILEKFEIERVYWQKRNIDWGIVTDNEIDKIIANNISFVYAYDNITNLDCFNEVNDMDLQDLVYEFMRRILDSNKSMRAICSQFDNEMSLEKGSGLSIFKYLIINKIINIDITKKIDVNAKIFLTLNEKSIKKVEII
ncbi:TnsA endonuclease [Clostridium botulinum]|uniref:heteromeric transposase endonuclease subunit TnsA n=1 Tax=Clostridium botulinum TaxID=1491 RepID=UPI0006A705FD|nr:heteromeric transposase endonuclease subunit TnsA [Clostridium botulinum]KOM96227.1 TnsA endonuclease [Clostridium botulinum]KON01937.1 TnsA endonuclease [Clostridium botulinum]MBY7005276.1 heteromeric transposase endonuclease subunit TnsA [Clostridium botulinum]MCR1147877.1 heteromeric transposase endonuclease subunit TnsA [Clostridium botulinum]NFH94861.1 heteromeric transposase endonuclease subunit TnsA [Clostridium botulinum]